VKEQKMALELSAATRERDFYMKQVDHGKAIDAMSAKQQRRAQAAAAAAEAGDGQAQAQQAPPASGGGGGKGRMVRTFQQVRPLRCRAVPCACRCGVRRADACVACFGVRACAQRPVRAQAAAPRMSHSVLASVFGTPRDGAQRGGGGGGGGAGSAKKPKLRAAAASE
jgi:hypothetical protein